MKYSEFFEKREHGRTDFPIQCYCLDSTHPRYLMQLHWHAEMEIIQVHTGELLLHLNRNTYRLAAGDVAIVNPGTLHHGEPHDCTYDCAVFKLDMLSPVGSSAIHRYIKPLITQNEAIDEYLPAIAHPHICEQVGQLFSLLKQPSEPFELAVCSILYGILYECYRSGIVGAHTPGRAQQKQLSQLTELLEWIDEHYTERITLAELSSVAGINEKYLCRFFKQYTNCTPVDYINRLRVEKAAEDMRTLHRSVTEAAFAHGFNDSGYFCKVFRRVMGESPRTYRKKMIEEGEKTHVL